MAASKDESIAVSEPSSSSEERRAVDAIDLEDVRARSELALFGAAKPARVGRFVLIGPIAGGGMGVVYHAYDPQLDRRVALKVLRPDRHENAHARERLMSEARALAKLDHPNVVPVHDVTVVDDQVVIVMELVSGQTLAAWERAQPRSWQEIVAVYVEAGRGLAAAHKDHLVHRDFKPANAIVGDDGRVRVLDFGLARVSGDTRNERLDRTESRSAPGAEAALTLTATGEIVGTVGYMAPEQLAGAPATAHSDQFSFCVALHRAIHGVPPFSGTTAGELLTSIRSQRPAYPASPATPSWLRDTLERGLAVDPADRHPSMASLLEVLQRERGWRRWRAPVVAAALAAFALSISLVGPSAGDAMMCDGGSDKIGAVWNVGTREGLQQTFDRIGTPYAKDASGQIVARVDRFRDDWSSAHTGACLGRRSGTSSDAMLDRRMICLDQRLAGLKSAITVLHTIEAASLANALAVVDGLPRISGCEPDAILAGADPPGSPAARAQVTILRARLADAEAVERAGRSSEALGIATTLLPHVEATGYIPLLIDALLVQGRILLIRNAFDGAAKPLRRAEELALEHGLMTTAVTAAARRIYVDARSNGDLEALLAQGTLLEALSRNFSGDHFARPLLLNNLAVVHNLRNEPDQAIKVLKDAQAALRGAVNPDVELTAIDRNLAMLTTEPRQREVLVRGVWQRRNEQLGTHHLFTLEAQVAIAYFVADPALGQRELEAACNSFRTYHPELLSERIAYEHYLAFLTDETGDHDLAVARYAAAAALADGSSDSEVVSWGHLSAGYVDLYGQDFDSAAGHFRVVIDENRAAIEWWSRLRGAHGFLGAGLTEAALGRTREAVDHLEHAIAGFEQVPVNGGVEHIQRLALARMTLAVVLGRLGDHARARDLEALAAEFYRTASPETYRARLASLSSPRPGQ